MQKHWLKIFLGMIVVLLLALVTIPFLVNAENFRPTIQTRLSAALGRSITIGHLSFSLLKGSLVADQIAIADDPAFSTAPFLKAKSLQIGVELMPLLMQRQIRITNLVIDTPSINLLHATNGRWNFSSLGRASTNQSPQAAQQPSAFPDLSVDELELKDGTASVSSIPASRQPFIYSAIDLSVEHFSLLKPFPFKLSATLPASGTFDLTGNAGPLSATNTADTPFQANLQVKGFDPIAAGVLDPSSGISMKVDLAADLVSNGVAVIARGKTQADHLKLARTGSPAPHPVDIDFDITDQLNTDAGTISNIAIHAGSVAGQVTGTYRVTPQALQLDLHLSAPNLPIDQVEQLLPAFGVQLPTGSRLSGGTLTANLSASGPAAAITVTGPIEIENTTLQGFDLGSKIQGLNLLKSGGGTQIQTLRTTVSSSPQITQFSNIYGNLPQIGSATGSGTVSPSSELNFKMVATLSSSNVVGSVANQAVNTVQSYVGGFLHPNAKAAPSNRGIPITITGTASSPSIRANLVSMFK